MDSQGDPLASIEQLSPRDQVVEPKQRPPMQAAYVELLERVPAQWFVTCTADPKRTPSGRGLHPEALDKRFRVFISQGNRELFGRRWYRKPHGGVGWYRGMETHKSGAWHLHAVLWAPAGDLDDQARRLTWMDRWQDLAGHCRIERPECAEHVRAYVSKYVVKGGEVDLSPNFGLETPRDLASQSPELERLLAFHRARRDQMERLT